MLLLSVSLSVHLPLDTPHIDCLQALVDEAGIEATVRFTGYQPDPASFINMRIIVIPASVQPELFGIGK